jgi:hypothetical protein
MDKTKSPTLSQVLSLFDHLLSGTFRWGAVQTQTMMVDRQLYKRLAVPRLPGSDTQPTVSWLVEFAMATRASRLSVLGRDDRQWLLRAVLPPQMT